MELGKYRQLRRGAVMLKLHIINIINAENRYVLLIVLKMQVSNACLIYYFLILYLGSSGCIFCFL